MSAQVATLRLRTGASLVAALLTFSSGGLAGADPLPAPTPIAGSKPTVAVIADPSSFNAESTADFLEMLRQRFGNGGTFTVIDNAHRQTLLNEQSLASAGQVTPATEARLGRMLGVNYLVVIRIDKLDFVDEKSADLLSLLSKTPSTTVRTRINLHDRMQIVDVRSGAMVQSLEDGRTSTAPPSDGTNRAFITDAIPKLLQASADSLIGKVDSVRFISAAPVEPVSGRILDVSGETITLSIGSASGIAKGQIVDFYDTRVVRNPDTRKSIQTVIKRGSIQIMQVEKDYSIGIRLKTSPKPVKYQIVRVSDQ